MPDPLPSCFWGGAASAAPPVSTASGPNLTTSIYETHLGLAALTWSRTVLGLSLRVDLRLPSVSSTHCANDTASVSSCASGECTDVSFRFRLRPWLFWKRRGSKRFQFKDHYHRTVDFVWDLTRARFPEGGGPEPYIGFFVAVAVDGEMFLVVGDSEGEAYKKTKARNRFPGNPSKKGSPGNPVLISRREHVLLPGGSGGGRPYTTRAIFGGKEREISIDLAGGGGEKDARMCLVLDGKRVLQVKRLKWKFRGNEKVEVEGGARVQVSWDVHNWLFDREIAAAASSSSSAAASTSVFGHAVFVFRFDREEAEEKSVKGYFGKHSNNNYNPNITSHSGGLWGLYGLGYFGNSDRSSSSIGGGGVGLVGGGGVKWLGKKRSLLKTSSSSSSSSASSGSSSSVLEWASAEENELQGSDGFSLLVYVWKN